jgi:hypothetical protein
MGYTEDLLDGLASATAVAGIGLYQDTAYATSDIGIGIGDIPTDCVSGIGITDYLATNDSPNQALGLVGIQFLFRGLPDDRVSVTNLADAVFQLWQGVTHRQFGTCHVIQMLRRTSLPLGVDELRRWRRADNYYLDINPPATSNRNQ